MRSTEAPSEREVHAAVEPRVRVGSLPPAAEATELRREIVEALFQAGGGHYGGALSVLDILITLYRRILRVTAAVPDHPARDRLILSKGHAAIALYAVLRRLGYFDDELATYGQAGSRLQGHPDMTLLPGVDFSTGSLGQGLSVGVGMAIALRNADSHVWVILGDGECQEGQVWEAALVAARYRLHRLHAVVDANRWQECRSPGADHAQPPIELAHDIWTAVGWRVFSADGHDHDSLSHACATAASVPDRPSVVIANTVKGKGFKMLEANPARFHCASFSLPDHIALLGRHS
jgi:transketolase